MKKLLSALVLCMLSGCGFFDRYVVSNVTGYASTCIAGVRYLQFPSGVTVQYDRAGKPVAC